MRRWVLVVAGLLAAAGLCIGTWRVTRLEASELEYFSSWQPLVPPADGEPAAPPEPHRELGRVKLQQGENVTFEICAHDQLQASRWAKAGLTIAVWVPATQKVAARTPIDAETLEQVTRAADGACLVVARGGELTESGEYAIEAVWAGQELPPELGRVSFQAHVLAFRTPEAAERWPVVIVLLGAVLFVIAFVGRKQSGDPADTDAGGDTDAAGDDDMDDVAPLPAPMLPVWVGLGALAATGYAAGLIPIGGALGGLLRALVIALVQVAVVVALVRSGGLDATKLRELGLQPARQGWWVLALAPLIGVALWYLGQLPMRLIPATGQSAVGAMVAWPSGSLAVALVSVLSPVVEEIFFRGFVFGSLNKRLGAALAFVITVVVFAAFHLPQTWGAWGGFTAILLTGVGLTALRLWTGSTLVPILAHLAHNSTITLLWVFLSRG